MSSILIILSLSLAPIRLWTYLQKKFKKYTRLFLHFAVNGSTPALMSSIKGTVAKIAYKQSNPQIVDLSSPLMSTQGKKGILGYIHTIAEEKLWAFADENSQQRLGSVQKRVNDRSVHELGAKVLSNEQRAAIFSKAPRKPIKYEQQSMEDFYKTRTALGLDHSFVYNFVLASFKDICDNFTPEIAIIIGRPLHILEDWLTENVEAFK